MVCKRTMDLTGNLTGNCNSAYARELLYSAYARGLRLSCVSLAAPYTFSPSGTGVVYPLSPLEVTPKPRRRAAESGVDSQCSVLIRQHRALVSLHNGLVIQSSGIPPALPTAWRVPRSFRSPFMDILTDIMSYQYHQGTKQYSSYPVRIFDGALAQVAEPRFVQLLASSKIWDEQDSSCSNVWSEVSSSYLLLSVCSRVHRVFAHTWRGCRLIVLQPG